MPIKINARLTRREWIRGSILAGGSLLTGAELLASPRGTFGPAFGGEQRAADDPFAGGKQTGTVEFTGEGREPMETPVGDELDGRLYMKLSGLASTDVTVATEKFYIRTRASRLLNTQKPWAIQMGGPTHPAAIPIEDLIRDSKPQGVHLMECAGNAGGGHFGLIGVADWAGVPLTKLADRIRITGARNQVLISGFDEYTAQSATSVAGASWIFPWEDLHSSGAFLATKMNGQPLTLDHGAPVRLVVPGWYGCTCIKWVNEIAIVDGGAEPTSQMKEYAVRTHQEGVPKILSEYQPAKIDSAALPIRVEKWLVKDQIKYRVVGILWGGEQPVKGLQIRFNPQEDYVPVKSIQKKTTDSWTFWTLAWTPRKPDRYTIRLRVSDPPVRTRRLDMGFYDRTVDVAEV